MRPPPTRIGNGGRYARRNAAILPRSTSSEMATISKSLRSSSLYSCAMWGNSSRHGSHHDAQKFTSVTLPANRASVTVSPFTSGSAKAGAKVVRSGPAAPPSSESASNARPDRKSTRLNSSHLVISYAVFCLQTKTQHAPAIKYDTRRPINKAIALDLVALSLALALVTYHVAD